MSRACLPSNLQLLYNELKQDIGDRLIDFENVSESSWFYELCFCLCTPQSSAQHALIVQQALESMNFLDNGQDVVSILRNPTSYIRFHNTKHKRLHKAREQWPQLHTLLLDTSTTSREKREYLADIVQGFGMKEASHFLRNIGHKQLAILDRHLLKNLVLCGVYTTEPSVSTIKRYEEVEQAFLAYGVSINISIDELDLLFWCAQTGYILK